MNENEMAYNIRFLKNFCFNNGIKVIRKEISTSEEFDTEILERNFYRKPLSTFCLVQQVSPEDIRKYFILGIRIEDFYIKPIHHSNNSSNNSNNNKLNNYSKNKISLFTYEKIYLFISEFPVYNLLEMIFKSIIHIKKLNFLNNLNDFCYLFIQEKYDEFCKENSEKNGEQIKEILNFCFKIYYPKYSEFSRFNNIKQEIVFNSKINNISFTYTHFPKVKEKFLAIDFLADKFFNIVIIGKDIKDIKNFGNCIKNNYNKNTTKNKTISSSNIPNKEEFYEILLRILCEQSFIFICEDIEKLTMTVLGFANLLTPFTWPFILIPNLPTDMITIFDSPVPYLIGTLGGDNIKNDYFKQNIDNINANVVQIICNSNNDTAYLKVYYTQKFNINQIPSLCSLQSKLNRMFGLVGLSNKEKSKFLFINYIFYFHSFFYIHIYLHILRIFSTYRTRSLPKYILYYLRVVKY